MNLNIYKEIHFIDETIFPLNAWYSDMGSLINKIYSHFHDEMEIIYFKEGGVIYEIDEIPHKVDEESILFFPSGVHHRATVFNFEKHTNYIFVFNLSIINSSVYDFCSNKYISPIINNEVNFPFSITSNNSYFEELKNSLLKIYDLNFKKEFAYELEIKSEFFKFFTILYKNNVIYTKELDKKSIEKKERLKKVFSFIHDNYFKDISRKDIIETLDIGEAQFTRFFKEVSGATFTEYLNSYRIIKSAYLLIYTKKSITDIAYETGFQDLSYYIKIFNKQMGVSPNNYRKNIATQTLKNP